MRLSAAFVVRRSIPLASFAAIASVAVHLAIFFVVRSYLALPDLDVEFEEPTEIEFGLATDELPTAPAAEAPPPAPEPPEPPAAPSEGSSAADAGPRRRPDASIEDAGVPDAGDSSPVDAGRRAAQVARATESARSRLGAGANVALRFDFARIRDTELAPSVTALLGGVRDFQAVISASGLDPVSDLDQFVMTSRNPWRREQYWYVGHLRYGDDWARERVAALAAAKGMTAEWTEVDGIPVAPWHDDDPVERVLALLGDGDFVLAPVDALPTIQAWLASIEERGASGATTALGVAPDEVVSLEAENIPRYLAQRHRERAPTSSRLSILVEAGSYDVAFRADYADGTIAEESESLLRSTLDEFAGSPAVRLMGLGGLLGSIEVESRETRLRGHASLRPADVQLLLATAQSMLRSFYEDLDAREAQQPPPAPTP